jgi:excisionase family DNA binding protein
MAEQITSDLLTVAQAAKYLNLSESMIWNLLTQGVIRSYRFKTRDSKLGARRISKAALDQYIMQCEVVCAATNKNLHAQQL